MKRLWTRWSSSFHWHRVLACARSYWQVLAIIFARVWIWWNTMTKTAAPLILCMCACVGMKRSTRWNIAALQGAVVGGGLELASAAHIRVMDQTAYFALPEGQRGLFTGGGATIRVTDLVGKARMIDMMLTGRVYQGQEAVDLGLAQYIVEGSSLEAAMELARKAAQNLPLSNFAICSAVSHIQNMSAMDGAYAEAVVAGVVNTQPEARARLAAFADKSAARVRPNE